MRSRFSYLLGALAALALTSSAPASATILESIGSFTGLPTNGITSATIKGTFGTPDSFATAGVVLSLDGIHVAQCNEGDACNIGTGIVPWSFNLTDFSIFADGSADLTGLQTSIGQINIGPTELDIVTDAGTEHFNIDAFFNVGTDDPAALVPEPGSLALLILPLAVVAVRRSRLKPV